VQAAAVIASPSHRPRGRRIGRVLLVACALALASGCATPVGVDRVSRREVDRELATSALWSNRASAPTRELLTRLDRLGRFEKDPDATLAELHAGLAPEADSARLFALAELSYLRAQQTERPADALAAAVYAYAFLFASDVDVSLATFDARIEIARAIYNRGLALGLAIPDSHEVSVAAGSFALPFGTLTLAIAPDETFWVGFRLGGFRSAADYRVRGLQNRYRRTGIGAPLAASLSREPGRVLPVWASRLPKRLEVPVTLFLRLDDVRAGLASGALHGRLELYSEDVRPELVVDGRTVPLELEKSSSLALMLEGSEIWNFGVAGFRLGDYLPQNQPDRLMMLHPYLPGHIPMVFVHGTFSSPATWAEMINELENDPEIAKRFQPWLFIYNSGNPIGYSGGLLVEALREIRSEVDPKHADAALDRMVVIGHSQGGLLTKLTVVSSGDRFWRLISPTPFDQVDLSPDNRELLHRSMFFEPLPFVTRVIFLSTPHHGSYLARFSMSHWISRLVKMPISLTQLSIDLATQDPDAFYVRKLERLPTSLDNMSPSNGFLQALAELPIAPGVTANSIIAVRGDGPLEDAGDGVVRYTSAHIAGVESEKVVRGSGHSVQETQEAIQEVRRILLEHAAAASP